MPEGEDDALREAAAHRGLKLVKSRKRKAGVGDYGRYGLTDGGGKELLGFGPDGLAATPTEIRDYLRKSEISTWAQSAEVTPDRPIRDKQRIDASAAVNHVDELDDASAPGDDHLPRRKGRAPGIKLRRELAPSAASDPAGKGRILKRPKAGADQVGDPAVAPGPKPDTAARRRSKPEVGSEGDPRREPEPPRTPEPEPEPVFEVRAATKADLDAIGGLIAPTVEAAVLARRFEELRRAGGGVLVASRDRIVACLAWHAVLSLHEQPIGRVTLLVVEEDERRRGTGAALVAAAAAEMAEQRCDVMEAMSEIELRNVNGFYRATGFEQRSYRFVREALKS